MRKTLSLLTLALGAILMPPQASADSDQDRARSALLAGEILPLPAILERVAKEHPGNVLEVELDREGERWIYELKILQGGGGLLKLKVDARDAQIIKRREHRR